MPYTAPTGETSFILEALAGYSGLSETGRSRGGIGRTSAERVVLEERSGSPSVLAPWEQAGRATPAARRTGPGAHAAGFAEGYGRQSRRLS